MARSCKPLAFQIAPSALFLFSGIQLFETAISDNPKPLISCSTAQSSNAVSGLDERAKVVASSGPNILVMFIATESRAYAVLIIWSGAANFHNGRTERLIGGEAIPINIGSTKSKKVESTYL
ncbi:unannotated protein [freshwater metagenome]|uniref:Unannotated protein n=1 Tax=freshwater metagenome TaxID=449393 RepID=A0A6J6P8K0_9ZZZZ